MRLVTYLAVSVLAASLVAAALYGPIDVVSKLPALTRVYTRWVPPEPPPQLDGLSEPERAAFRRLGARVRGQVVWSSNREGNHELYLVDLTTGEERRLTRHPNVEFFSRFSPDGTTISFLRSQREWVSFREDEAWDLFLIDADGGNERRVARKPTIRPGCPTDPDSCSSGRTGSSATIWRAVPRRCSTTGPTRRRGEASRSRNC